jgi:SAM-dependent methyltransferase
MMLPQTLYPRRAHPNFYTPRFEHLTRASLSHLLSLDLPLDNRSVLELGPGPGDHTGFYLDRGCKVTCVDARPKTLDALKDRHPKARIECRNLDTENSLKGLGQFDIIHCFGLLYHLEHPYDLIEEIGNTVTDRGLVILCTCVSGDSESRIIHTREDSSDDGQSVSGVGCRPSRLWIYNELSLWFPYVYLTESQPDNPEFPLDWTSIRKEDTWDGISHHGVSTRCVFVASMLSLDSNPHLVSRVPMRQSLHQEARQETQEESR